MSGGGTHCPNRGLPGGVVVGGAQPRPQDTASSVHEGHGEALAVPQHGAEGSQEVEPEDEVKLVETDDETVDGELGADGQGDVAGEPVAWHAVTVGHEHP